MIQAFSLTFLIVIHFGYSIRYDNYVLYNLKPEREDHLIFLQNLKREKYINIIFWNRRFKLHKGLQVLVSHNSEGLFLNKLKERGIKPDVLLRDVQKLFDNQTIQKFTRKSPESHFTWDSYHDLDDVIQWLFYLAEKYPQKIKLETIGSSDEGRSIYVVCLKNSNAKHSVLIEGGIHSNEWLSVCFVTYLINELINPGQSKNKHIAHLSKAYEWYFIPVLNPDGYAYSHKVDRLWRKNRRKFNQGIGVDLNRNFGHSFCQHDSSKDPTDDNYCGPQSFSEAETRALHNLVSLKKRHLRYYVAIHAYGQVILLPYEDQIRQSESNSELENYGKQAMLEMYKAHGGKYSVGTSYNKMGLLVSGTSTSWVRKNYKIKYVFTFVLRDNGTFGFALPSHHIRSSCDEALTGLTTMMTATPRYVNVDFIDDSAFKLHVTKNIFLFALTAVILS